MPKTAQSAVLAAIGLANNVTAIDANTATSTYTTADGPVAMDLAFAKKFLENCSPKTQKVLRHICEAGGAVSGGEIETEMGIGTLRGVWSGTTTRIRRLTGDPDANLIGWVWNEDNDAWDGNMHPQTVKSLLAALPA